jgi:hypothetical protein
MTKRIGNKDQAQRRSKEEKLETRRANIAREAIRQAEARARNRHQIKNQPSKDSTLPAA